MFDLFTEPPLSVKSLHTCKLITCFFRKNCTATDCFSFSFRADLGFERPMPNVIQRDASGNRMAGLQRSGYLEV